MQTLGGNEPARNKLNSGLLIKSWLPNKINEGVDVNADQTLKNQYEKVHRDKKKVSFPLAKMALPAFYSGAVWGSNEINVATKKEK